MQENQLLKNRFSELAERAEKRWCWTYSEFLTPAEQAMLCSMKLSVPHTLDGAYPDAERRLAVFGNELDIGYAAQVPIVCLHIAARNAKFADDLSHRDFLGALMSLGIRREMLGDILVSDKQAWLLCLESIADYICSELTQVRHTVVEVTRADELPEAILPQAEARNVVLSSERLDAVIAAVYDLSRSESQLLIRQAKVFINSRAVESTSLLLQPNDLVSVRGHGRFRYSGICRETRKGRLRADVQVY